MEADSTNEGGRMTPELSLPNRDGLESDQELFDMAFEDVKKLAATINEKACAEVVTKLFTDEQKVIGLLRMLLAMDAMETATDKETGQDHGDFIIQAACQIRFHWLRFYRDIPE